MMNEPFARFSWFKLLISLTLSVLISGCSSELDAYQKSSPRFALFDSFQGQTRAWGMVQDFTDKQTRRFEVVINGAVEEGNLVLVEDFVFDDGEVTQRIWSIERLENGNYRGYADDIIGFASGKEVGNALHWQYDFALEMDDDSTVEVHFDDWMYRQDPYHVFNITSIKKFGIEVGRITLFFQKSP